MREQGVGLEEGSPSTLNQNTLREVADHFPAYAPDAEILLGVGGIFSYFAHDIEDVEASLRRFLSLSESLSIPVWIKLDGEQWWQARPDLWNWWDPSRPGYDPDNAKNVEWSHWGTGYALKVAWRDWGQPLRVLPPPNLMSPDYREAVTEAMERLVPIIAEWYAQLPQEKKALFAGLNVGWETAIGTSSYYLPNGNEKAKLPPGDDLEPALKIDDSLSRGVQQIGYAAVSSAGIRDQGDLEETDLVEVVRRHLEDLSRQAYLLGVPRDKIFTHPFGNAAGEALYDAAVNEYAYPGWSEYWYSKDIMKNQGVRRNLQRPEVDQWGAVEWLLLYPVEEAQAWYTAIKRTINAPGLKLMCIYNWENTAARGPNVPRVVNQVITEGLDPQALLWSDDASPVSSLYEIKGEYDRLY
ncbi:hypothetical protein ACWPKO_00110 [Coraliomargarita sp. W4R53]